MQTGFQADKAWNSNAKVASHINATFWSLEVALPRKMLEPSPVENQWLFNVHRKMHSSNMKSLIPATSREYSYWLPTYDTEHPWWPHSPQEYTGPLAGRYGPAMGLLTFIPTRLASEDFASETKVQVATLDIKGNSVIPTEVIQGSLPIQPEDVITIPQLSWLIAELQEQGRFQNVRLETKQVDGDDASAVSKNSRQQSAISSQKEDVISPVPSLPIAESRKPIAIPRVRLHIRVTEAPVLFAQHIQIEGNRSFPFAVYQGVVSVRIWVSCCCCCEIKTEINC